MNFDDEMTLSQVEDFIKSLTQEYEDMLWQQVDKIIINNAALTYTKVKRIKKQVLFTFLRKLGNLKK